MTAHEWWCCNCEQPRELDRHARCACCSSDAVDILVRPEVTTLGLVAAFILPDEMDRLLIEIAGASEGEDSQ
jgi:hypothetical protein